MVYYIEYKVYYQVEWRKKWKIRHSARASMPGEALWRKHFQELDVIYEGK